MPQNRPRVLIVGFRKDVWEESLQEKFQFSLAENPSPYAGGGEALIKGFLPKVEDHPPSLEELLGDLLDTKFEQRLVCPHYLREPQSDFQRWLRTRPDGTLLKKGTALSEQEYSNHSPKVREKFAYMLANNGNIPDHLRTKKFAQRVLPRQWNGAGPNITATSLPDDYVHYAHPRTPTVREWARIQTFPDWYQFVGPRTTGGRRRAGDPDAGLWDREVPKYTQIGNAVPVLLAKHIAAHFKKVLQASYELTPA